MIRNGFEEFKNFRSGGLEGANVPKIQKLTEMALQSSRLFAAGLVGEGEERERERERGWTRERGLRLLGRFSAR